MAKRGGGSREGGVRDRAWLQTLCRQALERRGVTGVPCRDMLDGLFAARPSLIGCFLESLDEEHLEQTVNRLESEKFLRPRGSMALDPGTQVVGTMLNLGFCDRAADKASYYASLLHSALAVFQSAEAEGLESVTRLFTTSRVFAEPIDRLEVSKQTGQVLVLLQGRVFLLTAIQHGQLCSKAELQDQVQEVLERAEVEPPSHLASLTALPKREAVIALAEAWRAKPDVMEAVQQACLCLSIVPSQRTRGGAHANQLKALTGEGTDRWFGKTNLVADSLGHVGIYADHAVADGLILKQFFERFINEQGATRDAGVRRGVSEEALARPLSVGGFSPALEAAWQKAARRYRVDASRISTAQFTLQVPKSARGFLAAAVPVAAQAAFFAQRGTLEAPYLPVSKRSSATRGLDFLHATPPGVKEVAQRFATGRPHCHHSASRALKWWTTSIRKAVKSRGGERFLHYFYRYAEEAGVHDDRFFEAVGFPDCLSYPRLCLSVMASPSFVPGLAFPPVEGGWGLGATIFDGGVNLTATAWNGEAPLAARNMRHALERILAAPPPALSLPRRSAQAATDVAPRI